MRLRIDLAYDGRPFHGFARQRVLRTDEDGTDQLVDAVPTVQGDVEQALSLLLRQPVTSTCAGRTDAGVHALGQVLHVELDPDGDPRGLERLEDLERVRLALDKRTHEAITIWSVAVVDDDFDARFSAVQRRYRYQLHDGIALSPLRRHEVWHVRPPRLDTDAMQTGAAHLLGEHDFTSFCRRPDRGHMVRRIDEITVDRDPGDDDLVRLWLRGPAFCHQMVRSVTGSLLRVGRGDRDPGWIAEVLTARDRAAAAPIAPPHGLTLLAVDYP